MLNPFPRLTFQDHFLIGFVERVEEEKQVFCFVARRPELLIKTNKQTNSLRVG